MRSELSLNHLFPLKLFSVTPRHLTPTYARTSPFGMTRMITMGERRILRMSPQVDSFREPGNVLGLHRQVGQVSRVPSDSGE